QKIAKEYADKKRQEPPSFEIGDLVWLSRRNIKTTRPCSKLDYKQIGPYKIVKKVNEVAYKLELPSHFSIHPVFHVSLLEPYIPNEIPNRIHEPPPPIEIDNDEEWEVEEILDSFVKRRKLYYVVKWKGYPESEATPEPPENLRHCQDLVANFHARYPMKPKPSAPYGSRR